MIAFRDTVHWQSYLFKVLFLILKICPVKANEERYEFSGFNTGKQENGHCNRFRVGTWHVCLVHIFMQIHLIY